MLFIPRTLPQRATPPRSVADPDPTRRPELERLRALLDAAAELDLTDHERWRRLRATARPVIAVLVAGGRLPAYLAIGPDDPPVLVARTLAAAWQLAQDGSRRTP